MNPLSTIAAISTPYGSGGISVIRVSGDKAIDICDKVYKNKNKSLASVPTHTINYGFIKDADGNTIDEVLVSVMKKPNSYTGEDVVEINCHGGIISTNKILEQVLLCGAELATPGEFTKRAFLNGRIDLVKAESVIDIINSKTELEHNVSVNQLEGRLSKKIDGLRQKLLSLLSHVQVLVDYPEEDLEPLTDDEYTGVLKECLGDIEKLIETSKQGKIIREGVKTAIVGKPNVGKSSLLNLLYGDERAIVTDIAGTTRDTIEEYITVGDVMLKVIDTAGIHETDDVIENIGVDKSRKAIESSDLIIFMVDASVGFAGEDEEIAKLVADRNPIVLINKSDTGKAIDKNALCEKFDTVIEFSVKEETGLNALKQVIKERFDMGAVDLASGSVITNVRHRDALIKAGESIKSALESVNMGFELNLTFIDIEDAIGRLGEIVGLTVGEEVVDRIFHNFCLGK